MFDLLIASKLKQGMNRSVDTTLRRNSGPRADLLELKERWAG
jgi:hypothetical protein